MQPVVYYCQKHTEQKEALGMACLKPGCTDHRLLCRLCCAESHIGHETLPIDQLFELSQQIQDCHIEQSIYKNLEEWAEEVRAIRMTCLTDWRMLRQTIEGYLVEAESRILIHLEQAEEAVLTQMERLKRVFPKYQKIDVSEPFETVNTKIGSIAETISQYASRKQEIIQTARQAVELTKQEHRKVEAILQQIDVFVQHQLATVVRMPHNHQPGDSEDKQFSKELKHSDIVLRGGRIALREKDTTGGQHLFGIILGVSVMGNINLEIADNQSRVYRCCMKMHKIKGGVYIGIALQKRTKLFGFEEQDWVKLGHGNYLVSNHGRCISHSDKSRNNEIQSFRYGQGDIVEMKFETGRMSLVLSTGVEEVALRVEEPRKGDCYRFVAFLMCRGDSIEIVELD